MSDITPLRKKQIIDGKNIRVVELIIEKWNYPREEAIKLWYSSRTKRVTLDSQDLYYVSPMVCIFELELELNNDPTWMTQLFE